VHGVAPISPIELDSGTRGREAMASQKQMRYLFGESVTFEMCQDMGSTRTCSPQSNVW
jgi:hypothetical protein